MLSRHPREDSVATRMDSFLARCIFPGIFTEMVHRIYIRTYENSLKNLLNVKGKNFLAVRILLYVVEYYRYFFFMSEKEE